MRNKLSEDDTITTAQFAVENRDRHLACPITLHAAQIEWVADFSLEDEDSENIASERYENRHLDHHFLV